MVGSKSYGYNENNLLTRNDTSGIEKLLVSFNDDDYKGKDFIQGTGQNQEFFFPSKYISDSFNTKIYFLNE